MRCTPEQGAVLARLITDHPGHELRLDHLGQPGQHGSLLATFGAVNEHSIDVLIEETGAVETDPEGVIG